MAQLKSTLVQGALTVTGNVVASKLIKNGGTSDDILLGDGSTTSKSAIMAMINAAVVLKGTAGTNGTVTKSTFPAASETTLGDAYKVITADTYQGVAAKVGDMLICYSTGSGYAWMLIPSGDDIEDTWREVQLNGTQILAGGTSTKPLNLKAGTNMSISNSDGTVTFTATDTGATVVSITGDGNAFTNAEYNASTRTITFTKGLTFLTSHQSIKTLNTNNTTAQTASASEAIAGSGTINLHKISKTGSASDLTSGTIPNGQLPYRLKSYCASPGVDNADAATEQGFYYVKAGDTKKPAFKQVDTNTTSNTGNDYHVFTTAAYSADWLHQLGFDCRSNDLFVRRRQNGVWQPWTSIVKFQPCTGDNGNTIGTITDNAIPRWDTTRNTTLQNSGVTIDDNNNIAIPGIITQGTTSTDTTISSMNRFEADLFVSGNGVAPNSPKVAGFYLGKSAGTDENRHMDIVTGSTVSYIDFNRAGTVRDYDVRLRVNNGTGDVHFQWGSDYTAAQRVLKADDATFEAAKIVKTGGTDTNVLLDAGGVKAVADFAMKTDLAKYLPLTGSSKTDATNNMTGSIVFKDVDGIIVNSNNKDVKVWSVWGNSGAYAEQYGFHQLYKGTGSGQDNTLHLYAHNETSTQAEVYEIKQNGSTTWKTAINFTGGISEGGTALSSKYQALDADLTSIAGLTGTSGFLKKTAANTWALDTSVITGSGTSGYIAKFNGTNSITNGPAFGSDTTKYLRNDGTWVAPPNDNTEYGADRGISLVSGKFGHSNTAITAQSTKGLYKISYDAYGHITGTEAFTLPTVNDGTLTMAASGTGLSLGTTKTFTANQSTNATITYTIDSSAAGNRAANKVVLAKDTGQIDSDKFTVTSAGTTKSTIQYNTTEGCLEFVFA